MIQKEHPQRTRDRELQRISFPACIKRCQGEVEATEEESTIGVQRRRANDRELDKIQFSKCYVCCLFVFKADRGMQRFDT